MLIAAVFLIVCSSDSGADACAPSVRGPVICDLSAGALAIEAHFATISVSVLRRLVFHNSK